jgi:hypothetical protein
MVPAASGQPQTPALRADRCRAVKRGAVIPGDRPVVAPGPLVAKRIDGQWANA